MKILVALFLVFIPWLNAADSSSADMPLGLKSNFEHRKSLRSFLSFLQVSAVTSSDCSGQNSDDGCQDGALDTVEDNLGESDEDSSQDCLTCEFSALPMKFLDKDLVIGIPNGKGDEELFLVWNYEGYGRAGNPCPCQRSSQTKKFYYVDSSLLKSKPHAPADQANCWQTFFNLPGLQINKFSFSTRKQCFAYDLAHNQLSYLLTEVSRDLFLQFIINPFLDQSAVRMTTFESPYEGKIKLSFATTMKKTTRLMITPELSSPEKIIDALDQHLFTNYQINGFKEQLNNTSLVRPNTLIDNEFFDELELYLNGQGLRILNWTRTNNGEGMLSLMGNRKGSELELASDNQDPAVLLDAIHQHIMANFQLEPLNGLKEKLSQVGLTKYFTPGSDGSSSRVESAISEMLNFYLDKLKMLVSESDFMVYGEGVVAEKMICGLIEQKACKLDDI